MYGIMDKSMYNRTMNILPNKKSIYFKKQGFTLVEVLVATTIFIVVMLVAITALLASQQSSKKGQAIRSALDNVQFSLESITRSGRLGSLYTCINSTGTTSLSVTGGDCTNGTGFAFALFDPVSKITDGYAFYLGTTGTGSGAIFRCISRGSLSITLKGTDCTAITAPEINVTTFATIVDGSDIADGRQPSVKIMIEGNANASNQQTQFFIQTLVSQRQFE